MAFADGEDPIAFALNGPSRDAASFPAFRPVRPVEAVERPALRVSADHRLAVPDHDGVRAFYATADVVEEARTRLAPAAAVRLDVDPEAYVRFTRDGVEHTLLRVTVRAPAASGSAPWCSRVTPRDLTSRSGTTRGPPGGTPTCDAPWTPTWSTTVRRWNGSPKSRSGPIPGSRPPGRCWRVLWPICTAYGTGAIPPPWRGPRPRRRGRSRPRRGTRTGPRGTTGTYASVRGTPPSRCLSRGLVVLKPAAPGLNRARRSVRSPGSVRPPGRPDPRTGPRHDRPGVPTRLRLRPRGTGDGPGVRPRPPGGRGPGPARLAGGAAEQPARPS